jgi:hypothetical protein
VSLVDGLCVVESLVDGLCFVVSLVGGLCVDEVLVNELCGVELLVIGLFNKCFYIALTIYNVVLKCKTCRNVK